MGYYSKEEEWEWSDAYSRILQADVMRKGVLGAPVPFDGEVRGSGEE